MPDERRGDGVCCEVRLQLGNAFLALLVGRDAVAGGVQLLPVEFKNALGAEDLIALLDEGSPDLIVAALTGRLLPLVDPPRLRRHSHKAQADQA
ncbi:protein of unknown function [Bradyrhizobium sp. ORS 285]|nr:protein of unknown function [Bradyrhizobium sp. ORS 285]